MRRRVAVAVFEKQEGGAAKENWASGAADKGEGGTRGFGRVGASEEGRQRDWPCGPEIGEVKTGRECGERGGLGGSRVRADSTIPPHTIIVI